MNCYTTSRLLFLMAVMLSVASSFRPFSTTNFFGLGRDTLRQCKLDAEGSLLGSSAAIRAGANVQTVKTIDDFELIEQNAGEKLIVVDFGASWCMPCKMIAPIFEAYSKDTKFKKTVFVKVDVDESQELAMKFGVQSMPTFLFIKDGKILSRFSGSNADKLRETIQSMQ